MRQSTFARATAGSNGGSRRFLGFVALTFLVVLPGRLVAEPPHAAIPGNPDSSAHRTLLEQGMLHAVKRIPELEEAFRAAQKEGVELLLYGGTTRSLGFYVKKQLQEKGEAFFRETSTIPLEEVVGPYSDLDLIMRGSQEAVPRIEQILRSEFPEGERFYRWEIRAEDFLKEPWQITQGYEPISKILLGKNGFVEPDWRRKVFDRSLTEQGVGEILSGEISYFRNPRYRESAPYQQGEHHEILEAMRYFRFLNEFPGVRPTPDSLEAVRAILREVRETGEARRLLSNQAFRNRFENNLHKLQYTSLDNVRLMRDLEAIGFSETLHGLGYAKKLRLPLPRAEASSSPPQADQKLGKPLVVYHGTKGYKQAWAIHRGGFFVTTYSNPAGVFVATDPDEARAYAGGNEDFLLKVTLSPEARIEEDLVRHTTGTGQNGGVWIVKNSRAVAKIERPLTLFETKGKLLGAVSRLGSGGTIEDVEEAVRDLETRARQGNNEAYFTLGSLRLPPEFENHQRELFDRLLAPELIHKLDPARVGQTTSLGRLHPEFLSRLVGKVRDSQNRILRQYVLLGIGRNSSLPRRPIEDLLALRQAVGRKNQSFFLQGLAANRSLDQFPPEFMRTFVEDLRNEPVISVRRDILRTFAKNPSSVGVASEMVPELVGALKEKGATDLLRSFVDNPALSRMPAPILEALFKTALRRGHANDRGVTLQLLARNPSLVQLPKERLAEFTAALSRTDPTSLGLVLQGLEVNHALEKVAADLLDGIRNPRRLRQTLRHLASSPALPRYPVEVLRALDKASREQPRLLEVLASNPSFSGSDRSVKGARNWLREKIADREASERPPGTSNKVARQPQSRAIAAGSDGSAESPFGRRLARAKHEARSFGKGMGIWMGALALSDAAKSVGSGRWRDIPGQIASMVHPESLASLSLNYGSFSAAARAVEQPMLWIASKGSAQALKSVARFAGPLGFFAGSAVADLVTTGQLDLERWLVSGFGFLGTHALLNATVAPLILTGLGLSSTGIGATVGVPILILAGSMLGATAIEHGYYWLKDYLKRRATLRHEHEVTVDPSGSTNRSTAPEPRSLGSAQGGGIGGALDQAERAMR